MAEDDPYVGDALRIANNLPDFGNPNVEANNLAFYKRHVAQEAASKDLKEALGQTWPVRLAKDVYSAAQLPGDVYAGRTDPMSDEGVKRAIDLAGAVMGGSFPMATPGTLGMAGGKMVQPAAEVARELNPLGMYSYGAEAARNLPQPKGHPDQFKAMLLKAGVKPDELAAANWDELAAKPIVTREDVAARFRDPGVEETVLQRPTTPHALAERQGLNWTDLSPYQRDPLIERANSINSTPTKYHDYQIPGGENYREVLLKAPMGGEATPMTGKQLAEQHGLRWEDMGAYDRTKYSQRARSQVSNKDAYQSSHWEDPNVIAHMRMSDRTGPNNEKILHLEELQSDWAQEGRKQGFKQEISPAETKELEALRSRFTDPAHPWTNEESLRFSDLNQKENGSIFGLPKGPYVDNTQKWTDLGLKRALMEAAKGGYDKMIWTPGAEQAKRYSLTKQLNHINYDPQTKELIGTRTNGNVESFGHHEPEALSGVIGEELSKKLLDTKIPFKDRHYNELRGLDMEVGGEGMKGYYDKIVPTQLSKLVKKLDPEAKVELNNHSVRQDPKIPFDKESVRDILSWSDPEGNKLRKYFSHSNDEGIFSPIDQLKAAGLHDDYIKNWALREGHELSPKAHSIQITPRMREQILKGFPHYASGGAVPSSPPEPTLPVNTAPSEAQKAAGNYKKAHLVFQGLEVSIENPKGSERTGTASNGRKWSTTMPAHYGYIKSTVGADKDHVDVYIGHNRRSDRVFVIDQCDHNTGRFDEHKVLLGYDQKSEAIKDYCNAFSDGKGKRRIAAVHEISMSQLKKWLKTPYTKKAFEKSPPRFH